MIQLQLELYKPNTAYLGKVIREDPYVKILGPIEWNEKFNCLAAVAQVESSICIVAIKEVPE